MQLGQTFANTEPRLLDLAIAELPDMLPCAVTQLRDLTIAVTGITEFNDDFLEGFIHNRSKP